MSQFFLSFICVVLTYNSLFLAPFLRGLLMKVMSYLPELMFDSLGGAMGLGSTLSGWAG